MKENLKSILVLSPLILLFVFGYIRSYWVDIKLKENGRITIGRFDSIEEDPKRIYIGLSYYIGDKKHTSFESALHTGVRKKDIGKFYEMKYLPESPEIVRGNYSKQIIDTAAILKAGFSRQEIENKLKVGNIE